jgi:hypothetical protein
MNDIVNKIENNYEWSTALSVIYLYYDGFNGMTDILDIKF